MLFVTNRYVHGPGTDEPLVWYDGSGVADSSRRFLYADHIGSITGITDNAGTVLVVNTYDPYGVADPQNFGRFSFTGQIHIPELDLYYYKARIYSPALGRFLQTDPIGYADQLNLYAYVGNDPTNLTDPMGLARCGDLEGHQCEGSLDDADRARADIGRVKAGIDAIASKMANGDDLTKGEQAFVDAIGEKFGDIFTTQKGLNGLSEGLGKIYNKIGARGEGMVFMRGDNKDPSRPAYVNVVPTKTGFITGNKVYLNDLYFRNSDVKRTYANVHEPAHLADIFGDFYIRGGQNPLFNNPNALSNADTYACLVVPSRCGY